MPDEEQLLSWRVAMLEKVSEAIRIELYDTKRELHQDLRENYLDRAQMKNDYVPRQEQENARRIRREWPVILATIAMAGAAIANLVVALH